MNTTHLNSDEILIVYIVHRHLTYSEEISIYVYLIIMDFILQTRRC